MVHYLWVMVCFKVVSTWSMEFVRRCSARCAHKGCTDASHMAYATKFFKQSCAINVSSAARFSHQRQAQQVTSCDRSDEDIAFVTTTNTSATSQRKRSTSAIYASTSAHIYTICKCTLQVISTTYQTSSSDLAMTQFKLCVNKLPAFSQSPSVQSQWQKMSWEVRSSGSQQGTEADSDEDKPTREGKEAKRQRNTGRSKE